MRCIKIHDLDSVAVAVEPLEKGGSVNVCGEDIVMLNDVPAGHKFSLLDIARNENIVKYGYPIGHAVCDIKKGEHVHVHNTKSNITPFKLRLCTI